MPSRYLTPEHEDALVATYQAATTSMEQVARDTGISVYVIRHLLRERGIAIVRRGVAQPDRRYQCTPEEETAILLGWKDGDSVNRIHLTTNLRDRVIKRVLEDHGIVPEPRRKRRGRYISQAGYVTVWVDEAERHLLPPKPSHRSWYITEHRLVMARELERPLETWEHVHHINGDRTDNRLGNLQLRVQNHGSGQVAQCRCCGSHEIEWMELA